MWYAFKPYVPVAERRRKAMREIERRRKKGAVVDPIAVSGRVIAKTFWGKAWCDHLESYGDFANRLPRGRTYVRNGSVMHLGVAPGRVEALVHGSEVYEVSIGIAELPKARWARIVGACTGRVDSLVELLQGRLSRGVMEVVTDRDRGLFPAPREIEMKCSCPDWATMCKHVAAALYGLGARLDERPELLFSLRGVDHLELLSATPARRARGARAGGTLASGELAGVFGIDLDLGGDEPAPNRSSRRRTVETAPPRAKRVRRTASDLEDLADRIVELVASHRKTGLRAEEIRRLLGVPSSELARPIALLLLDRRLRKIGRKRATTYFAR